jgi:hypothetical protein
MNVWGSLIKTFLLILKLCYVEEYGDLVKEITDIKTSLGDASSYYYYYYYYYHHYYVAPVSKRTRVSLVALLQPPLPCATCLQITIHIFLIIYIYIYMI